MSEGHKDIHVQTACPNAHEATRIICKYKMGGNKLPNIFAIMEAFAKLQHLAKQIIFEIIENPYKNTTDITAIKCIFSAIKLTNIFKNELDPISRSR